MVKVVGVAGGSGSGKTTFARKIVEQLGARAAVLAQDSYYRDMHKYFDRDGGQVNFDHPDALEFELLTKHIEQLKSGKSIEVPIYDFTTHSRTGSIKFESRPTVVVDGILLLTQPELREFLDIACFIDTREELRFQRRLERDVRERGRTAEGVHEQFYKHVKPMHDLFVEPSRRFADRVISGERDFNAAVAEVIAALDELD